jgi:hypothetical protein
VCQIERLPRPTLKVKGLGCPRRHALRPHGHRGLGSRRPDAELRPSHADRPVASIVRDGRHSPHASSWRFVMVWHIVCSD